MSPLIPRLGLLRGRLNGIMKSPAMDGSAYFGGSVTDFSDTITSSKVVTGEVRPYRPFLPNMCFSFAVGTQANISLSKGDDDALALFFSADIGPSPWLALECSLETTLVQRVGAVFALLEASAVPSLQMRACIRLQKKNSNKYVDGVPQIFALNSQLTRYPFSFSIASGDISPHNEDIEVRLIFFMPLRNLSLCLRRLTIAPLAIS